LQKFITYDNVNDFEENCEAGDGEETRMMIISKRKR
jgi:hypothetical protein